MAPRECELSLQEHTQVVNWLGANHCQYPAQRTVRSKRSGAFVFQALNAWLPERLGEVIGSRGICEVDD